ncbi:MAG: hypothetical protein LBG81_07590 [Coriobacteriaceae bacterium]|jgi:hypothetical protein|nr:hypothetical protein [Coriobacteriaceae bacterium]
MSISLVLVPISLALGLGSAGAASATIFTSVAAAAAAMGSKAVLGVAAEANLRHIRHLRELYEKSQNKVLPPVETVFNDAALLQKTLVEHGLAVTFVSENRLLCQVGNVTFDYLRETVGQPFKVTISGLQDTDAFLNELECLETEYRQNVQSYTYNKLIENLSGTSMRISEEAVLEDNSLLLTIDI